VPQIKVGGFPFPCLACDIDRIDQSLIGWNDPAHSYDKHNLIFDVPWKGMPRKKLIQSNTRGTAVILEQEEYTEASISLPANPAVTREEVVVNQIFSTVKHYPPKWVLDLRASAKASAQANDAEF